MMDTWLKEVDRYSPKRFILYATAASILLAAWMQYIQHGWINPDTLIYFEQARLFAAGEWRQALDIFNWPLYGICIAAIHKLTFLDIHQSAQSLNMVFFGVATYSFLTIIKLANGTTRTLFWGTLLLFSAQYIVGDALEMLMRDQGFWAFYLASIVCFIKYNQTTQLRFALLWQGTIIVAMLFRIEAILYLLLLPFLWLIFTKQNKSQKLVFVVHTYALCIIFAALITVAFTSLPDLTMSQFGRLDEVFNTNVMDKLTAKLTTQAEIMADQVLGHYLDEFALQGLLLTFIYVIIAKSISTTGLIPIALSVLGIRSNKQISHPVRKILLLVMLVALIAALLIITKVFVLSGRYLIALTWILLIFASFYLHQLSTKRERVPSVVTAVIVIILGLSTIKNILPKAQGYNYQQNAVTWLKQNSKSNEEVFYSDPRMRYYANAPFIGKWDDNRQYLSQAISSGSIRQFQYLVINHDRKHIAEEKALLTKLETFSEIKRFYARKKRKYVSIYKADP